MDDKKVNPPKDIGGPIRWKAFLPISIEKVFQALDTDEGRASFWAESAIEVDDEIEFEFINGVTYRSKILDRNKPDLWGIEYFGGVARFDLIEIDGGTELLLTHEGVSRDEWIETYAGWLNVLLPLKAWVIYNVDLRNHDPNRTWNDGFIDQ